MIRYRTERGLSTLILVVAAILLTRSWWSGELVQWIALLFRSMRGDEAETVMTATRGMNATEGMSSVSYAIISILGDLVYGVVLVFTWIASNVKTGFRIWWDSRFPSVEPQPEQQPVLSVTAPAPKPVTLADVLGNIQNGLVSLQTQIDQMQAAPKVAPKTTRARKAASNDTV